MKKNDKLIVLFGVVILVMASVGVYYWAPTETKEAVVQIEDFYGITGVMKDVPTAITVSDENPFYPLITTPVAVHYNSECEQEVIPLLIQNMDEPSTAITKLKDQVDILGETVVVGSISAKNLSLDIAKKYWDSSEAALIIEDDQSGYELGVFATPIASYLSIPVIVTDEVDSNVMKVLNALGVEKTLVCGENLEGTGKVLKFETVEEIVNVTIKILNEKFGAKDSDYKINYITLTNPIDAWPPKVLDSEEFYFGPETIKSTSSIRGSTITHLINFIIGDKAVWKFTIPEDYKYALIEFDGFNHEVGGVDTFGDTVAFDINSVDGGYSLSGGGFTNFGVPKRDEKGNVLEDSIHNEMILYDCGGKSYTLSAKGEWALKAEGQVSAHLIIKKLENPFYSMMENLSTVAPYLTSYHKGIIFGKPEFAFAANDEAITDDGKTCPGFYQAGRNPALALPLDKHVYDKIHEPLNKLLAQLAGIPYDKQSDLEYLTKYYKNNPVYIALVGDATALPSYLYQNEAEPVGDIDGDGIDDTVINGGTDSDTIYGNIDPVAYDWSNEAQDVYSEYPYLENIVGRITGWDVQDADALVVRTIFYEKIIENMQDWEDNFGNLCGGGIDFQKPAWVQVLNHIPGVKLILNIVSKASMGFINYVEGPWKVDTGYTEIMSKATENKIGKDLGFKVETALDCAAMIDGYSNEALDQIKNINLFKKLTFSEAQIKELVGKGNVKGREILENSNFIWLNGHGMPNFFGMAGPSLISSGFDGFILNAPNLWNKIWKNLLIPYIVSGFVGPGSGLDRIGDYSTRVLSTVDFGPSFVWLDSCTCGKISGIYPVTSSSTTFIHSGVNAIIASTTGSNIPGGYLEPKNHMYDTIWSVNSVYKKWEKKAQQGVFPDFHFGPKIYNDLCHNLKDDGVSLGRAYRDARNVYLPEDADWNLWWSPPLTSSSSSEGGASVYGPHLSAKYTSFQEFSLYGDPAFIPYMPSE